MGAIHLLPSCSIQIQHNGYFMSANLTNTALVHNDGEDHKRQRPTLSQIFPRKIAISLHCVQKLCHSPFYRNSYFEAEAYF